MPTIEIAELKKREGTSTNEEPEKKKERGTGRNSLPHVPRIVSVLNAMTRALLRIGIPMGPATLLRVRGRKTGKVRRQPIGFFKYGGSLYLFSTFGETNWVKNIRAAGGQVIVGRGSKNKAVHARELTPKEAAPIIKQAIAPSLSNPFVKMILGPHVNLALDAPLSEFVKEAERHPVFELLEQQPETASSYMGR